MLQIFSFRIHCYKLSSEAQIHTRTLARMTDVLSILLGEGGGGSEYIAVLKINPKGWQKLPSSLLLNSLGSKLL